MSTNAEWRLDPWTNSYLYNSITDEQQTVALSSEINRYIIELDEAPRILTGQDSLTVVENVTGGATWTEISSNQAPSAGEYRIDRVFDTGRVEFNAADNAKNFLITYQGKGSPVRGLQIQTIETNVTTLLGKSFTVYRSSSCGLFQTTSATFVDVTNLSLSVTTDGKPVLINVTSDGTDNPASIGGLNNTGGTGASGYFKYFRDAVDLGRKQISLNVPGGNNVSLHLPPTLLQIDEPAAGTYTYKLQTARNSANVMNIQYCVLEIMVPFQ